MSKKDAYVEKMEAQVREWDAELAKLQAKADEAEADAKIEYEKQIGELRSQKDAALTKLSELKEESEGTWENLTDGLEATWKDFKASLDRVVARFK